MAVRKPQVKKPLKPKPSEPPKADPSYLCLRCSCNICKNCKEIAAEHEYISGFRVWELYDMQQDLRRKDIRIEMLEEDSRFWQEIALKPFPEILAAYLKAEAEKGQRKFERALKRLDKM